MKRLLLPGLFLLLSVQLCMAQTSYRIKGSVTDTLNVSPLYFSSVILIRAADSIMESWTRANEQGMFSLPAAKPGKYLIQIAHPGYADYGDIVMVKDTLTDLHEIPMLSKEHMLKEFVFTQQVAAIKIKGDTTEYMADSFGVQQGASVEDLLKKLPGIQVDKNGKITAHGTQVEKILVDGEEFFSDDPKVVTQGLQAAVVNKVQVFDKKSDQAEFTGIDDGEKTRTINLMLKENMKKGYFGRVEAGGGTDGYYQEQGMINAFKGKRQLSAFGIVSNTDKVGLGWEDKSKFGGGNGITEIGDDGSWNTYVSDYDEFGGWSGTYSGDGLPHVWTGGAHYANKWNEDKQHLSGSYRYALQQVDMTGNNSKIYALGGDTSRVSTEDKRQFNSGERNGANVLYEVRLDTFTTLKIMGDGGQKKVFSNSSFETETYNMIDSTEGISTINRRTLNSVSDEQTLNADLLLRRKFAKTGRTLSLDFKENYKDTKGTSDLNSSTRLGNATAYDTIDQKKEISSTSLMINGKLNYTEPLSKTLFAEANYAMTVNNSTSANLARDRSPVTADYDVLRDSFSTNYRYDIGINRGGLGLRFVNKKFNISAGTDVSNTTFLQTDLLHGDTSHTYNYFNVFPKANFNYKFSKQTSFRFNYTGNTKQPTITQIQPLNQNTDPLNIVVGNPDLKQEFVNRFNTRFSDYRPLSHRYINLNLTFTSTDNAISTSQYTDGARYVTQYVNVDGNYSVNWYTGIWSKIRKPGIDFGFSFSGNSNRVNNIVNNEQNTSLNNAYTLGGTLSKEKDKKYEWSWNPKVTYNDNRSTINVNPINYWVLENELDIKVQLPGDVEIGSSVNMMQRQKTVVFTDNNSITKWNAHISKKLLKKKELQVKLMVFDILNQNLGYTRTAQGNMIMQNSYTTIRRYGMLSVTWNFTHSPMGDASATDNE